MLRPQILTTIVCLTATVPAWPQGWSVGLAGGGAAVDQGGDDSVWWGGSLDVSWRAPRRGGFSVRVEPRRRYGLEDTTLAAASFRHFGEWTLVAEVAATPAADFYYRWSAAAAVHRHVGGGLVPDLRYRRLEFPGSRVHLLEPGITRYVGRGEFEGRAYLAWNVDRGSFGRSLLVRGSWWPETRFGLTASLAVGEGIFDATSFAGGLQPGWTGSLGVRFRLGEHDELGLEWRLAHERPRFDQQGLLLSYRKGL